MRPLGLKPTLILEVLRGAEAPLFHGVTRIGVTSIRGFFAAPLDAVRFPALFMR